MLEEWPPSLGPSNTTLSSSSKAPEPLTPSRMDHALYSRAPRSRRASHPPLSLLGSFRSKPGENGSCRAAHWAPGGIGNPRGNGLGTCLLSGPQTTPFSEALCCGQLPSPPLFLLPPSTFSLPPSPPLPPWRRLFVLKPRIPYVDQAALELLTILLLQSPHRLGLHACSTLPGYFELFRVSFEDSTWWMTQGNLELKANLGYRETLS